jgi:protein ImuA
MLQDVSVTGPWQAAAAGFVLASLPEGEGRPILWVQDRASRRALGRPCEAGLRRRFGLRAPILRVEVGHPRDALRAMEEGAGCAALGAVLGEVDAAAPMLDLVATKRLALRARDSGVPVWLMRLTGPSEGLSAARMRWRVSALPSAPHPWDEAAPGAPRWRVELLRAAGRAPGTWDLEHERGADPARDEPRHEHGHGLGVGHGGGGAAPHRLRVVPEPGAGPVAAPARAGEGRRFAG